MQRQRSAEARNRILEQVQRMGRELLLARTTSGLPRSRAAKHAGIAPSTLDRLESGDPHVGLETLARACRAVGLDLSVRVFPGRPPSLRDTGQLAIAEHLRSQAHPSWHTALELLVDEASTPRAIDLALFGANEILDQEIERLVADFQAQYRNARAKQRALAAQHARPVRLVLVIENARRNRAAIAPHLALVSSELPAGSREVLAAIRRGTPLGRDGLLWVRVPAKRG